jgi:hypothetical protein
LNDTILSGSVRRLGSHSGPWRQGGHCLAPALLARACRRRTAPWGLGLELQAGAGRGASGQPGIVNGYPRSLTKTKGESASPSIESLPHLIVKRNPPDSIRAERNSDPRGPARDVGSARPDPAALKTSLSISRGVVAVAAPPCRPGVCHDGPSERFFDRPFGEFMKALRDFRPGCQPGRDRPAAPIHQREIVEIVLHLSRRAVCTKHAGGRPYTAAHWPEVRLGVRREKAAFPVGAGPFAPR